MAVSGDPRLEIEAVLRERTSRDCLYVPSGRFGLYVALRAWLSPGNRILMSPVDDDVVLFTVLAAGLRPVMTPLSPSDGNIDPDAVPDATWSSIRAVLTTNLYGLPDRLPELRARCDALGIVLVEDAAHALHTDVAGRPVGSWGDVSVFSLSKHAAGVGGVIAFADGSRRDELVRTRATLMAGRRLRVRVSDALRPRAVALLERLRLGAPLRSARRALGPDERREHRMPLRPGELEAAVAAGPALEPFDPWVRVDKHDYRLEQRPAALARTVERLQSLPQDRAARLEGVARLRELAAAAPALDGGEPIPLFRVPLLVHDRDAAAAALEAAGHPFHYVYDPPLDDYAGDVFVDPSPSPEAARWWARHVLPVDPLLAEPALRALRSVPHAVRPAAAPSAARKGAATPP
jgi:DegT/DnrJ/EryC1/StrS aminotransferase family